MSLTLAYLLFLVILQVSSKCFEFPDCYYHCVTNDPRGRKVVCAQHPLDREFLSTADVCISRCLNLKMHYKGPCAPEDERRYAWSAKVEKQRIESQECSKKCPTKGSQHYYSHCRENTKEGRGMCKYSTWSGQTGCHAECDGFEVAHEGRCTAKELEVAIE